MPRNLDPDIRADGPHRMNIYVIEFASTCPNNGKTINYRLEIRSTFLILAEDIEKACDVGPSFHESLADEFQRKFGGRQELTARHGRVEIQTIRGEDALFPFYRFPCNDPCR